MKTEEPKVIIPRTLIPLPKPHELEAAWILARHYKRTIELLRPIDDYKRKTADFVMDGVVWEIKAPEGNSKETIGRILKRASKQSVNIVLDCRRTALPDEIIKKKVCYELTKRRQIKRVVMIMKDKKVIEIQ